MIKFLFTILSIAAAGILLAIGNAVMAMAVAFIAILFFIGEFHDRRYSGKRISTHFIAFPMLAGVIYCSLLGEKALNEAIALLIVGIVFSGCIFAGRFEKHGYFD